MAELQRSIAALRISGDALNPSDITRLLGCEPTLSRCKGDQISSAIRPHTAKTGQWHLAMPEQLPGDLDSQLRALLDKLTADLSVWHEISSRFDVDIFCGLFMEQGNEGLELSADTLKALGDRKILLGLDIYGPIANDRTE
jgi:hypothetical protein